MAASAYSQFFFLNILKQTFYNWKAQGPTHLTRLFPFSEVQSSLLRYKPCSKACDMQVKHHRYEYTVHPLSKCLSRLLFVFLNM